MSATWGYFSIEIKKSNKTMDKKLAKKIFDWCKEHFDWFGEGVENEQLCLEDGKIYSDNDFCVEDYSVEMEPLGWLNEVYEEFHPEQMIVRNVYHYTNAAGEYTPGSACFRLVAACVQDGELVSEDDFYYGEYEDPSFEDFFHFYYQADDFHGYMLGTDFMEKPASFVRLCFKDGNRIVKEIVELWSERLNSADEIEEAVINNSFCFTICDSEIPLLNAAGHVIDRFEKMDVEKTFKGTVYEDTEFLGIQWSSDGEIEMPEFKQDMSGTGEDLCQNRLKEYEDLCQNRLKEYEDLPLGIKNEFNYDDSGELYHTVIDVSVKELKKAINVTEGFNSKDLERGGLTGVRLKISGDEVSLVGCDGCFGGFGFLKATTTANEFCGVISTNILKYIYENLSGESVKIKLSEDYIAFENESVKCRSAFFKKSYPDIEGVVPRDFAYKVEVNCSEILAHCLRIVDDSEDEFSRIIFSYKEGMLFIAGGNNSASIVAKKDGDELFDIGFDADLLAQILSKITTDEVRLKFSAPKGPCIVEPVGLDTSFFLLVPARC